MAQINFEIEFRYDEDGQNGNRNSIFHLVACINISNMEEIKYPISAKYINGMVMYDVDRLKNDFPMEQFRRELIMELKQFVRSEV